MSGRIKKAKAASGQGLLFGTGGVPHSARSSSTIDGIQRIKELGLGCMELEFVQKVRMGEQTAAQVSEVAKRNGIRLSAHAPYYINFNSPDPEKIEASKQRLLLTARIGSICGAESAVFHTAFYMGSPPGEVYEKVRKCLSEVIKLLDAEKIPIRIRPEVMGKGSEFGTVDEVLRLSEEFERVLPALDVAHWHARAGAFNSYPEFIEVFRQIEAKLGRRGIENMHVHFSGIRYGKSGEISHLNFEDSDFHYAELLRAFRDVGAQGLIICESPNLEEDAVLLRDTYNSLP